MGGEGNRKRVALIAGALSSKTPHAKYPPFYSKQLKFLIGVGPHMPCSL
jgi:hypothetical protein